MSVTVIFIRHTRLNYIYVSQSYWNTIVENCANQEDPIWLPLPYRYHSETINQTKVAVVEESEYEPNYIETNADKKAGAMPSYKGRVPLNHFTL
jgi:hypothetical protein